MNLTARLLLPCLVTLGALSSGCGADVKVFGTCEYQGQSLDVGESVQGSGCETCTCQASGEVVCSDDGVCGCEEAPLPDCGAPPPGCSVGVTCDTSGQWTCAVECGGCENAPPIDCEPPPPGCTWTGPTCENGNWSCGAITCNEPCSDPAPECPQPGDPNCYAYPVCGELGWECLTDCTMGCEGPMPDCPPPVDPNCSVSIECFDGGWQCVENCVVTDCDAQYPNGYDLLVAAIVGTCGCQMGSPCAMSCLGTETCQTLSLDGSSCGTCIENEGQMGGQCIQDGAFGPACQNDATCAAYVDCLINQQG